MRLRCKKCGKMFDTFPTSLCHEKKLCHSCWYKEFGNFIEKHPVGNNKLNPHGKREK